MKVILISFVMICLLGFSLAGCKAQTPEPKPTHKPSSTPFPTATLTPAPPYTQAPNATPVPTTTLTPTSAPALRLGSRQEVTPAGFSFQSIQGYDTEVDGSGVWIFDPDRKIIISFYGVIDYDGNQTEAEIIDELLGELESRGYAVFEKSDPYTLTVGAFEGTAYDLTGSLNDSALEGQTILVMPSENQYWFALAIANIEADQEKWQKEGEQVLSTLLATIEFIETPELSGSACPVSSDKTYGYSKDNPIKVGGDWLDGPARERAYLDSLSGPNGESIRYERTGSFNHGNTILDEYLVSYQGAPGPATIYLDEYGYAELMAPVGFRCWTPIPLTAP